MKHILVTVKTKSKRPRVLPMNDSWYLVSIAQAPYEGEANLAVTRALADHLNVAPSQIMLIRGARASEKVFRIEGA